MGDLSNALFTAAVALQMSRFEPSLLCFVLFFRFIFRSFFWVGEGGNYYCCCSYSSIFYSGRRSNFLFSRFGET